MTADGGTRRATRRETRRDTRRLRRVSALVVVISLVTLAAGSLGHAASAAVDPTAPRSAAYWQGWDIARGVAVAPEGTGGYTVDAWGALHGFALGSNPLPPSATGEAYWPGSDIARGAALLPAGQGGYTVDAWGAIHGFSVGNGPRPPAASGEPYFPGWDIVRGIALVPSGTGGYVLDAWGGLHPFRVGNNPMPAGVTGAPYWPGRDIARGVAIRADGTGGYIADAWGGLHAFGIGANTLAPPAADAPYWMGWKIVRGVAVLPDAVDGLVLDGWGGLHHVTFCPGQCPDDVQPALPIRAAFYYPWFPEEWDYNGIFPYTRYQPSLGWYDSGSANVVDQHIDAMRYGGIDAGIASWWGPGSATDQRVPLLLSRAHGKWFHWALYYELEGYSDPSVDQLRADLAYIRDHYASDPSYLKVRGQFVVFAYADPQDRCGMADRWAQANSTIGAFVVLKVFPGWHSCIGDGEAWHEYGPGDRVTSMPPFSYTISPGFFHILEPAPRLPRDVGAWIDAIRAMTSSGAPWQLVTTFNEWGEGTAVESSTSWPSASGYGDYLDALHNYGG